MTQFLRDQASDSEEVVTPLWRSPAQASKDLADRNVNVITPLDMSLQVRNTSFKGLVIRL